MSLRVALSNARTEEDVKDAYISALGLKSYSKGLVDIQTEEVWFELKWVATPPVIMFAQLLYYVRSAHLKGEHIPPFLAVMDRQKAAIMETANALPFLVDKSIKWPRSGSKVDKKLVANAAPYVEAHYVVYQIDTHEDQFIRAVKTAISAGKIIRTQITPDNLRQVFDRWVELIGSELGVLNDVHYAVLFFADIMHDGHRAAMTKLPARLLYDEGKPVFLLNGETYDLADDRGYRNFWAIYDRPPERRHRHYLLERRDSLLPLEERSFKGAFYTPLHVVDKAYDYLATILGENWQRRYLVWDMCCGVGNLEVKHSNYRNVFMSTLDQADVDVMRASGTCVGATIFQYDYLNDDINDFGQIDYTLSGKLPQELRQAIDDAKAGRRGAKKILVLINPPYAEATSSDNAASAGKNKSKTGVAVTRYAKAAMSDYGSSTNELFVQFIARISQELPSATLAMFSKLKYVNSQAFEKVRNTWKARFLGGFVIHSKAFDGLRGDFPIGFVVWDTSIKDDISDIELTALDKDANEIGTKRFVNVENKLLLTTWVDRPPANSQPAIPLRGAILPATTTADLRGTNWSDGAVGWLNCAGNDLQQAPSLTLLLSSGFASGRGFFVNADNLRKAGVMFAVRRLIKATWLNDRDQFLQPSKTLTEAFVSDCLVWMLFNRSNLSAGADGLSWNGKSWSLVNHFIPFTESEVGAKSRFESDFLVKRMAAMKFTREAKRVLEEGSKLWTQYHATSFSKRIRDELRLNRSDAGWYQIRKALEANSQNTMTDFDPLNRAYARLTEKLRPQVYSLGFLPE